MLVKQDSCRLNNTESFLYTVRAMLTLLSVLFLLGKEFHSISMLFFVFYHFFFALNIQRVHKQVSDDVLLHPCFKKALFK